MRFDRQQPRPSHHSNGMFQENCNLVTHSNCGHAKAQVADQMIISQYFKFLFTTKHNEKQGDGQNLVFLSCNIYLSLCLYLQSFVMNVCVSTDW